VAGEAEQVLVTAAVEEDIPADWDARRMQINVREHDDGPISVMGP
jgi:DNA replication and repair protein RecF